MITFAAEMSKLYIFNPEHDIALSSNLSNFTAPHAGRQLRADLGFLPAIWAGEDDAVMVDNVEFAERAWKRFLPKVSKMGILVGRPEKIIFLPREIKIHPFSFDEIDPWGWDKALVSELKRKGVGSSLLLDDSQLDFVRQMSHRRVAASLLLRLQAEGTVGESFECTQAEEVEALLAHYGQVVMKAPWSSSGRGLRFLSQEQTPFQMQAGWFRHLVERQGSVMVEPYYKKVKDFGMEFIVDSNGIIRYQGLSLFHTVNGAYVGNILATESVKLQIISRYVPASLLEDMKQRIMTLLDLGDYVGPFGVDMMIVRDNPHSTLHIPHTMLHPCVEINLRRTMGHVALAISPSDDDIVKVMRIDYTDNTYKIKIRKL